MPIRRCIAAWSATCTSLPRTRRNPRQRRNDECLAATQRGACQFGYWWHRHSCLCELSCHQAEFPMRLTGLVPAALTPFDARGDLALNVVGQQVERFLAEGLGAVFVAGTTGEFSSLTIPERLALAERWLNASRGTKLRVLVHVGANALRDAQELAKHAEKHGAAAIATVAPNYVKPKSTEQLAAWCGQLAAAAPATPFYFYDIPVMTGVQLSMPEFVQH